MSFIFLLSCLKVVFQNCLFASCILFKTPWSVADGSERTLSVSAPTMWSRQCPVIVFPSFFVLHSLSWSVLAFNEDLRQGHKDVSARIVLIFSFCPSFLVLLSGLRFCNFTWLSLVSCGCVHITYYFYFFGRLMRNFYVDKSSHQHPFWYLCF